MHAERTRGSFILVICGLAIVAVSIKGPGGLDLLPDLVGFIVIFLGVNGLPAPSRVRLFAQVATLALAAGQLVMDLALVERGASLLGARLVDRAPGPWDAVTAHAGSLMVGLRALAGLLLLASLTRLIWILTASCGPARRTGARVAWVAALPAVASLTARWWPYRVVDNHNLGVLFLGGTLVALLAVCILLPSPGVANAVTLWRHRSRLWDTAILIGSVLVWVVLVWLPRRAYQDAYEDRQLSVEQFDALVREVQAGSADAATRARLVHAGASSRFIRRDEPLDQLFWLARHRPEAPVRYDQIFFTGFADRARNRELSRLWRRQVALRSSSPQVLGNAVLVFGRLMDVQGATSAVQRLVELEPPAWQWRETLAKTIETAARYPRLSMGTASFAEARDAYAALVLDQRAVGKSPTTGLLLATAHAARRAGDLPLARAMGKDALASAGRWDGNVVYDGHHVLGLVALAEGDMAAAKAELLEAGKTDGHPVLASFGPDFELADELLRRGERKTVLAFLDQAHRFWEYQRDRVDGWRTAIKKGETPVLRN